MFLCVTKGLGTNAPEPLLFARVHDMSRCRHEEQLQQMYHVRTMGHRSACTVMSSSSHKTRVGSHTGIAACHASACQGGFTELTLPWIREELVTAVQRVVPTCLASRQMPSPQHMVRDVHSLAALHWPSLSQTLPDVRSLASRGCSCYRPEDQMNLAGVNAVSHVSKWERLGQAPAAFHTMLNSAWI
jgi:hypothetical protein